MVYGTVLMEPIWRTLADLDGKVPAQITTLELHEIFITGNHMLQTKAVEQSPLSPVYQAPDLPSLAR